MKVFLPPRGAQLLTRGRGKIGGRLTCRSCGAIQTVLDSNGIEREINLPDPDEASLSEIAGRALSHSTKPLEAVA